jgi:CysZ protein
MPVFIILIIFVVFYTFTLIANILSAPFNSILAERVEARLNGLPIPEFAGYNSIPALITRTFKSELSKLWYLAKWGILLVIVTLIPVVNLIAPIAWTLFGAWMLAIEYADYPMGNHNLFFQEQKAALQRNLPEAMGFGWLLSLMTSIPVLNFLAMPVGVAGATALWVDKLSKQTT